MTASDVGLLVGGDFAVLTSFVTFLGQARKVKW